MSQNISYTVSLLGKQHKKEDFHCGKDSLDNYLQRQAGQEMRKSISVTYVLADQDEPERGVWLLFACCLHFKS